MLLEDFVCYILWTLYAFTYIKQRGGMSNRVWIIASHFANSKVNSTYGNCKVVNHTKNEVFPKENLIDPHYIFSHIYIISTFYSYIAFYYQKNIPYTQNYMA